MDPRPNPRRPARTARALAGTARTPPHRNGRRQLHGGHLSRTHREGLRIGAGPSAHARANAIDFCTQILGLSFHAAMRALTRGAARHVHRPRSAYYDERVARNPATPRVKTLTTKNRRHGKSTRPSQAGSARAPLRRQIGSKPCDAAGPNFAPAHAPHAPRAQRRRSLRPERGNWATNYDASPVKAQKTLRRHFGKFYDVKKIGNKSRRFLARRFGR